MQASPLLETSPNPPPTLKRNLDAKHRPAGNTPWRASTSPASRRQTQHPHTPVSQTPPFPPPHPATSSHHVEYEFRTPNVHSKNHARNQRRYVPETSYHSAIDRESEECARGMITWERYMALTRSASSPSGWSMRWSMSHNRPALVARPSRSTSRAREGDVMDEVIVEARRDGEKASAGAGPRLVPSPLRRRACPASRCRCASPLSRPLPATAPAPPSPMPPMPAGGGLHVATTSSTQAPRLSSPHHPSWHFLPKSRTSSTTSFESSKLHYPQHDRQM